jgi:hypothetical protein
VSYESDIASGAFVPSDRAKEVDALIAASTPETEPENWKFLGTVGWIYVGPLAQESSRSEYTAWVNRNLVSFRDIYENPNAGSSGSSGGLNYMTQAELDAYNQANGTNFSGNYLSTHPNTGEPGMWTWDPQVGWRDDTKWITTTTGPNFSANNPNAPNDPAPQIIGWYWDGSAWQPIYQGESAPAGTVVAPTSTMPTQPPQTSNGGGNNNNGGGNNNNGGDPVPIGWYWSGSAWLPFYQGEAPPAGLPQGWVAPTSTMPTSPPQGTNTNGTNTDGTNTDGTNTGGTDTNNTTPEPPPLFTPDGSMFFQGLFNASDLLYRDGNTVTSPYYNNARQNILDQLALQAASNGRTQNTAEEIQMAQNQTPSLSATGLFNPDYYALLKGMGIG